MVKGAFLKIKVFKPKTLLVRGQLSGINEQGIQVGDEFFQYNQIQMIYPSAQGRAVKRNFGAALLTGGIVLGGFSQHNDDGSASVPFVLVPLASGIAAYATLISPNRFNLKRSWSVLWKDSTLNLHQPSLPVSPVSAAPDSSINEKPAPQHWRERPFLDSIPIANWHWKINALQFIDKEFNVALEHHYKSRWSMEYGLGIVHPSVTGLLARSLFYAESMSAHTTGISARFALKHYFKTRSSKAFSFIGPEFKYRNQAGSTRIVESSSDYAYSFRFRHSRQEFQCQLNIGILEKSRNSTLHEFLLGVGCSIQHRSTSYSEYRPYPDAPVQSLSTHFDRDNGWFVLPRLQFSVLLGQAIKQSR